jgi:hypothetical protein
MYNAYLPQEDFVPVEPPPEPPRRETPPKSAPGAGFRLPNFLSSGDKGGVSALLKALKLEKLDSGDVLLLLIILLLLVEGDDLDLVIALGLVLILSLGEDGEETKH